MADLAFSSCPARSLRPASRAFPKNSQAAQARWLRLGQQAGRNNDTGLNNGAGRNGCSVRPAAMIF